MTSDKEYIIRELTHNYEDYVAYTNLIRQLTSQYKPYTYEIYRQMLNELGTQIQFIYMLESLQSDKKIIIGTIKIIIEKKLYNENSYVGHIEDVIIDQSYRKCGLGQQLINFAVNLCKNRQCYKIKLYCNDKISPFYQKNGFVIEGVDLCQRLNIFQ